MIITDLQLKHFRNYASEQFDFSDHINVITGANAQGKTNLLEALFFLARGYSHRATTAADLLQFEQPAFFARAGIWRDGIRHEIRVRYENRRKVLTIDGKKEPKHAAAGKIVHTILFEPDDLRIVKAGPEKRRRFMNEEISGHMPGYLPVLGHYRKALAQRNALLKEIRHAASLKSLLAGWDAQLVHYGARLIRYRQAYLKRLNAVAQQLHTGLSDGREALRLSYRNNVIDQPADQEAIARRFDERLKASVEEDIARGSTATGPQVDDMQVCIDGREARKYASQGQQRTAAIALKLSQIEIYRHATGDWPIVLLDDILSELDAVRQEKILAILGRTQAFITCTDSRFAERYPDVMKQVLTIQDGHWISEASSV